MWLSAFLNRCEFHLCLKILPEREFKLTLSAQSAATVKQTAASVFKNSLFLYTPLKCTRNKEVVFKSADIKPSPLRYTLGKHKTYLSSKVYIDFPLKILSSIIINSPCYFYFCALLNSECLNQYIFIFQPQQTCNGAKVLPLKLVSACQGNCSTLALLVQWLKCS